MDQQEPTPYNPETLSLHELSHIARTTAAQYDKLILEPYKHSTNVAPLRTLMSKNYLLWMKTQHQAFETEMLGNNHLPDGLKARLDHIWANTNHDINVTLDLLDMAFSTLSEDDEWMRDALPNGLQPTILSWPTHVFEYTARQIEQKPQPVRLDPATHLEYINKYFAEYMSYIPEAAITLDIAEHDDIMIDPYWLETTVFNVVRNAQKIVTDRDRSSKLKIAHPTINIHLGKDAGGCTVITVSDNGGGFPQELLEYAEEKDADGKKQSIQKALLRGETVRGTGLGLDIARQNMQDAKGKILLENNEEGAVVTFRFPSVLQ